jgi:hypothetical protein
MSCYECVGSRVSKEWKRMINNHPYLLNNLDFSDPLLIDTKLLTTEHICDIIKRSGKRLQSFHIWNHNYHIASAKYISSWSMDDIINALNSIGPSFSLERFILSGIHSPFLLYLNNEMADCSFSSYSLVCLSGHQYEIYKKIISELRPKLIELATCGCRALFEYDQAAKELLLKMKRKRNGNGNGESKNNDIKFRSRIAQYGTFRCSSDHCETSRRTPNGIGWYRICVKCSKQYCVGCASTFYWKWSNELVSDKSHVCSCSYCIDRGQPGNGKGDNDNEAGSLANTKNNNNNNDDFNSVDQLKPSSTHTSSPFSTATMIPPRYSCSVHCQNCPSS